MHCDELKPDYVLYAIGAMDEPERRAIRAHLESGCTACASELREALALAYAMGAVVEGPEPPRSLRDRVLAISQAPGREPARRRAPQASLFSAGPFSAWRGLALVAACLALALVSAVLWRRAVSESEARQAAAAALVNEQRSEARLRDQLAKLEGGLSMRVDPVIPLEIERGAAAQKPKQVSIPPGAQAVVLALPSDAVHQASAADLRDAAGRIIRSISPLGAAGSDVPALTIDARLLPAGQYSLDLRAGERIVARFSFVVESR